jgi:hypothetical protein
MESSPRANTRHAHFQCDDIEDSGEDSSSGLQIRSGRRQGRTALQRPPEAPEDATNGTIALEGPGSRSQSNPPSPENIGSDDSPGRQPGVEHEQQRDGILASKASPRSSSKGSATRQRVRMNSQPVSVSMPLMRATAPSERSMDIDLSPSQDRSAVRLPVAIQDVETREPNLSEKPVEGSDGQGLRTSKESTLQDDPSNTAKSTTDKQSRLKKSIRNMFEKIKHSRRVAWIIPTVTNFNLMKPVIRSSVAAWIGLVFLLINPILRIEGQSAFFSVVVAFIAPPSSPFVQAMEQIIYLWVFVGLAWAWVAICAACISAVRTNYVNPTFLAAVERKYSGLKATNPEQYQRRIVSTSLFASR